MCGIAGQVNFEGSAVCPKVLKKMTDRITYRGPDGEGHWLSDEVGLGHRRLSVIDPSSAGHQPMVSQEGQYVLSYNGEIYNFRELGMSSLPGYLFHSQTDSEVVLHALSEWGTDAFLKFNGMFAWHSDQKEKTSFWLGTGMA